MFAKGFIGYEENLALGMCTGISGTYLLIRLQAVNEYASEDYDELKYLFQLFERNIDKDKKGKILSKFTRKI